MVEKMEPVVGLFDNQEDAGQVIDDLSKRKLGQDLTLITSDQVSRKPPSVDTEQIGTEESSTMSKETVKGPASWMSSGWGSYIPAKTLDELGLDGVRRILDSRGIGESEARFYAEGVKHGGILLLVDAEEEELNYVHLLFQEANAVRMGSE